MTDPAHAFVEVQQEPGQTLLPPRAGDGLLPGSMGAKRPFRTGAVLLAAALCWALPATAEEDAANRAAARKLAEDGVAALQAGDSAKAIDKLDKALRTLRVPSIALWSGRALAKNGKLVEAAERLLEATRLPVSGDTAVQEQAKSDAAKELEQLRPRIPNLVIHVEGAADVTVSLDGAQIPAALLGEDRPVNPGSHSVLARRGSEERSEAVSVTEGERKEVTLRFDAATATSAPAPVTEAPAIAPSTEAPKRSSTLAFVALGAGAAGLVVGGITGGLALSKKSKLDDDPNCDDGACTHAVKDEVSSLRTFRTVSTIGFVAGGVLAATGVVLLLTSGSKSEQGRAPGHTLALRVQPSAVELRGSF